MTRAWAFAKAVCVGICLVFFLCACATSPTGRKQLMLVSDGQMSQMGTQAFEEIKSTEKITHDSITMQYVNCIVKPLTETARDQTPVTQWDVVVFENKDANAFALPGGKIGVYAGIIEVAQNAAQLATVVAHEIGHVISRHGAERVSQQAETQLGLAALGAITENNPNRGLLMGLLGVGAKLGIQLPFSRTQESEADLVGLDLMARAGFDPKQSIELWRNMIRNEGGKSLPQFLSDHPASENRITALEKNMPQAIALYNKAKAKATGKSPNCSLQKARS